MLRSQQELENESSIQAFFYKLEANFIIRRPLWIKLLMAWPSFPRIYFLANFSCPILSPRRMTFSTRSMVLNSFWSGAAVPRSISAITVGVVLHLVARSFCVIVLPLSFLAFDRAVFIASPTLVPIVLGLTISSLRSTFVRCWPSTEGPDYERRCQHKSPSCNTKKGNRQLVFTE